MRGGIEIGGRLERIKPGDIAVFYPRKRPDAQVQALCDRLSAFTQVTLFSSHGSTRKLKDEAVGIMPIHSARGMQFRIVLLLWVDLLPSRFNNSDDSIDRGLLDVAMTSTEDMLVILHSGYSAYIEKPYRMIGFTLIP
jgi:superfamily I DNA/RNA helicase